MKHLFFQPKVTRNYDFRYVYVQVNVNLVTISDQNWKLRHGQKM